MKKQIISGDQEIDISPQTPSAPTITQLADGSIANESVVYAKVTFLIFDESGKEINSLESEPSEASGSVTTETGFRAITITGIDTFDGDTAVKPNVIHRRIYLKVGSNPYYLAKTITDNTTTSTTILVDPDSIVEPPEYSLVSRMSGEDPIIEQSGVTLYQNKLDDLLKYNPTLKATGTPTYYARVSQTKILLYPKPSATYTLTYWVYRIPSRIFADTTRPIQLHYSLKEVLEAGVTFKMYEYKDSDGQESKRTNYEMKKKDAKGIIAKPGGQAMTVKAVC